MGLFIRLLLIVLTVKSQAELVVAFSGNQRTVSCELDISSKIDELKNIVENYLNMVHIELINTKDQVKELKVTKTDNQETVSSELEDTRRKMDELQVAVSGNQETVSSELVDTRRKTDELQVAVSGIQGAVSSELVDTRRKMDELQVTVSGIQKTVSSEIVDTGRKTDELQVAVSDNQDTVSSEILGMRRQLEELQVSVATLLRPDVNDCASIPCLNGAVCTDITYGYECTCAPGWLGNNCERDINECASSPCQNFGQCLNQVDMYVCQCQPGFTGVHCETVPKDCSEILARGVSMSGVYTVQPLDSGEAFKVYCDMETDGGGWTVFQRRQDGSVDFYLDFASYSRGFWNLEGEFWLGNNNLHRLTAQGSYELRIDITSFDNDTAYAVYDSFSIADVSDNYRLTLGSYSGTAGDSLRYSNNRAFSTKDMDNDDRSANCAVSWRGGWWYGDCTYVNLNGLYLEGVSTYQTVYWYGFKGYYSLKYTDMKLRLNS